MNEQEKAMLGADSVRSFVDQFGEPDKHVTILLQVLMEELWNAPPVSLLSESEQEGDQTVDNHPIGESSQLGDLQPRSIESSPSVGIPPSDPNQ